MSTTNAGIIDQGSTVDTRSQYAFDNADAQGPRQLRLLADILDEHTIDVLARAGIGASWHCLDVGPGAGTITRWMARQVQPGGHVTALDLDPRHVRPADNITIRQGDVRSIDLPEAHYDLIHTRLLLLHLAERDMVLDRLVDALKPGGLLVVSDWDATRRDLLLRAPTEAAAAAFDALQNGLLAELEAHGADVTWARRAPLTMRAAGLVDLETVAHNRLWAGGEPGCLLHTSNARQKRHALLARGITTDQLDLLEHAMADPATLAYCYWMFTTVGRRPE
jgi:2-polyprenyl-3-methyl-5-hydroxy-6-metoxy-1,4-benzoquinol methylase